MPAELERIVLKRLEKDRNLRYQHASDLRTDLQRLSGDSESGRLNNHHEAEAQRASPDVGRPLLLLSWPVLVFIGWQLGLLFPPKPKSATNKEAIRN